MTTLSIAVPSGVGDVLWALTKLRDFREKHRADHVTLIVQKSRLTRALEWASMVDFVDAAREQSFKPDYRALMTGYSKWGDDQHCFWPNAVVDRGESLSRWLPEYALDLDFEIKTEAPTPERAQRAVVYASSDSIHRAWFPMLSPEFWRELMRLLGEVLPTAVIGSRWDQSFKSRVKVPGSVLDLVGQTSLREVAGVIREARVVVGVICGMTILANHLRTPCVAFCPDQFPPTFPRAWVKPDAPYAVLRPAEIHSAAHVAEIVLDMVRKREANNVAQAHWY